MKTEAIIDALSILGVEIPLEKQKEFIKKIQIESDSEIKASKKDYDDIKTKLDEANKQIETDKSNATSEQDKKELDELRKFKQDTVGKETRTKQENAIAKLLDDNKFDAKVKGLLTNEVLSKYSPLFDENNGIKNSTEIADKLKQDYKDFVTTTTVSGATPANVSQKSYEADLDKMTFDEYKKFRNNEENK